MKMVPAILLSAMCTLGAVRIQTWLNNEQVQDEEASSVIASNHALDAKDAPLALETSDSNTSMPIWHRAEVETSVEQGPLSGFKQCDKTVHLVVGASLGKGAYGVVQEIQMSAKIYAGKLMRKTQINQLHEETKQNLGNEVEMLRQCQGNKHIVKIECETKVANGDQLIVMEFLPGDLFAQINDGALRSKLDILDITRQIADGLKHMHNNGVAHRDLKPENILFDKGTVKIADFGAAALTAALFQKGDRPGTFEFMSPEMLAASYEGAPVDVWSLGVILFMMLTGQMPWDIDPVMYLNCETQETQADCSRKKEAKASAQTKLAHKIVYDPYQGELLSRMSPLEKYLVQGMLKKDPKQRLKIEDVLTLLPKRAATSGLWKVAVPAIVPPSSPSNVTAPLTWKPAEHSPTTVIAPPTWLPAVRTPHAVWHAAPRVVPPAARREIKKQPLHGGQRVMKIQ